MKQHLNQVCKMKYYGTTGAKQRDLVKLEKFWTETYFKIYPTKMDLTGKCRLKVMIAQGMAMAPYFLRSWRKRVSIIILRSKEISTQIISSLRR